MTQTVRSMNRCEEMHTVSRPAMSGRFRCIYPPDHGSWHADAYGETWKTEPAGIPVPDTKSTKRATSSKTKISGAVSKLVPAPTLIPPKDLMMPGEVGALFGVAPRTVARWADGGKLTAIRTASGHRKYRKADVEELYRARTTRRQSIVLS